MGPVPDLLASFGSRSSTDRLAVGNGSLGVSLYSCAAWDFFQLWVGWGWGVTQLSQALNPFVQSSKQRLARDGYKCRQVVGSHQLLCWEAKYLAVNNKFK